MFAQPEWLRTVPTGLRLPDLGHLAHEEAPALVAGLLLERARLHGILPPVVATATATLDAELRSNAAG